MKEDNKNEIIKNNWIKNPTKKRIIVLTIVWATSAFLMILSMTNFFTQSVVNTKYFILYFLLVASTLVMRRVYSNYFRNKKMNTDTSNPS